MNRPTLPALPAVLGPYRDAIQHLVQPAIELTAQVRDRPLPPEVSRLGGLPALPAGTAWPRAPEGTPHRFVGQLQLAELLGPLAVAGAHDAPLPAAGLLSLFVDADAMTGPPGALAPDRYALLWWPAPPPLVPLAPPEDAPEPPLDEAALVAQACWSLPAAEDLVWQLPGGVAETVLPAYQEYRNLLLGGDRHQLLGHADPLDVDPRAAAWAAAGGGPDGGAADTAHDAARHDPAVRRALAEWRLLWQIASESDVDLMWGELGFLYLMIRGADLLRGDLARAVPVVQGG